MAQPNLPAGPWFSPLHAWRFIHRPRRYYAWLRGRYGDIVTLRTPHATLVMTVTAEGARQVFTANPDSFDAFQKEAFGGLAGAGSLWVLDGSRHRRERQIMAPPFHAQRVRGYGQAMQEVTLLHTDAWESRGNIRAYDAMLGISRDIVLRTVFGVEDETAIGEGRDVLTTLLRRAHPWIAFSPRFQAWWFPPWVRWKRAKHGFSMFVGRCLAARRAAGVESHDLLGLLLAARGDDGSPMRDDHIRDELVTILLAGHETTAVALAWALYELARHPAVLARLRTELDALGPDPDPDLIVKQRYLGAVCDETLRLHTILTEVARVTLAPYELLGYTIPAGIGVGVAVSAIHQDPLLYPEPDQFRPERFIGRAYSPFEFLPFGGGHRRCLGAALSDYEMRIALATITTRWDLELAGKEREIRHNIGMGPKHGVRMRVRGRRRSGMARNSSAGAPAGR
jgi:cytochrome P450 family 110